MVLRIACSLFDAGRRPGSNPSAGRPSECSPSRCLNPTGTHSGSHPKGRSNAADGIAVDRASMSVGLMLRVGNGFKGSRTHLSGYRCCTRPYAWLYSTVRFQNAPRVISTREPHCRAKKSISERHA